MTDAPAPELTADDLRGKRQLRRVAGLLSFLHDAGCDRDRAGNRELHFDDYVLLVLLYLFNPLIDSVRTLQKVAGLPEVRERLGVKRFSLGSFSESCRVFEPAMLQRVVDPLAAGVRPVGRHELLSHLPGTLTLVDSTVIDTLCTVAGAMFLPLRDGTGRHTHAWRLHLQFDVDRHVPGPWELTDPRNTGDSDEKSVLRRHLAAGRAADHPTRLVWVRCTPHRKRGKGKAGGGGQTGPTSDGVLRVVTDLLDVPAEVVAFLYGYRWTIEVFFRFLIPLPVPVPALPRSRARPVGRGNGRGDIKI